MQLPRQLHTYYYLEWLRKFIKNIGEMQEKREKKLTPHQTWTKLNFWKFGKYRWNRKNQKLTFHAFINTKWLNIMNWTVLLHLQYGSFGVVKWNFCTCKVVVYTKRNGCFSNQEWGRFCINELLYVILSFWKKEFCSSLGNSTPEGFNTLTIKRLQGCRVFFHSTPTRHHCLNNIRGSSGKCVGSIRQYVKE